MPDDAAFLRALDTDSSAAWRALPGCESPQPDPYTADFVDSLFTTVTPRQRLRWADVEARWTSAVLEQSAWMAATRAANECSDMLLVSVYRGEIAAALCSKLSSVGVLRRWLEFRRHLAAAVSAGGPDAAFVLDLSDRADVDIGLPKLASTGGCAANLPIPFALKGYGFNAWFSELGPSWRWPATAVGWAQRRAGAVWRGAKRSYGACVHATGGAWPPAAGPDGAARCSPGQRACYASNASVASARRTQLRRRCGAAGGGARCAARGAVRHPREVAVDAELSDLDAGFVRSDGALNASAQLVVARLPPQRAARGGRGGRAAAVARSSYVKREQLSFADLAHWRAVLVLDGFGYATSLAAAMTLGAAVVAPHSLYPMWFEGLLRDGDDVVRVDPSLDDLSGALRELRTEPERARRLAAAASRRACALFAPAHLASYVRRLLDRYAHAFDGAYPRELHERVRRLAAGATLAPTGGGGGGEVPVAAPEAPRLCARLYPRGQRGNLAC